MDRQPTELHWSLQRSRGMLDSGAPATDFSDELSRLSKKICDHFADEEEAVRKFAMPHEVAEAHTRNMTGHCMSWYRYTKRKWSASVPTWPNSARWLRRGLFTTWKSLTARWQPSSAFKHAPPYISMAFYHTKIYVWSNSSSRNQPRWPNRPNSSNNAN